MRGKYFHSECAGCQSYGIECETGCEYDDDPNSRSCFTPRVVDYEFKEDFYEEDFEEV